MKEAIVLEGVSKRFGQVQAVEDFSLRVPTGCIYGFLGPNGAGKTTIIRMLMSIFHPDAGRIEVLGQADPLAVKDRLGYLPEEKGLYKKMRVEELVAYFGRLKGLEGKAAKEKAGELLVRFGMEAWRDRRCEALSKGMGQKVQLLVTMVHEPELIILDEPFSGLDPVNSDVMRDAVLQMKREGRTVIFSTHIMEQAEQLCDYVVLIDRGKKVIDGPLSQVRNRGDQGIILDYDGEGAVLREVAGIARVNDSGKQAELFLEEGADPQAVLAGLVGRVQIRRFDLREPSLHEIFIQAVGGRADA